MENDKIVFFPHTIRLDTVQMTQRFKCKKEEGEDEERKETI